MSTGEDGKITISENAFKLLKNIKVKSKERLVEVIIIIYFFNNV